MARICRWRYTPGCENKFQYPSDTCLNDFTCTCIKLGNCLTACALEECFESCQPWSHWSDTCGFKNINDACWQYSTCETRWEIYRLILFIFSVVVIINLVAFMGTGILAYLHPPSAERDVPGFNVNLVESNVGMAEDISVHEEDLEKM
ncbi:unnamed protein product [Hymenolepis diminuta]|uniref:Folate_rec domain-containing protein n=1 Tax=Hymenolepis diminuta TaxID=6216 RepID=A0A0R3SX62_HYMDI|nr:unnamed protein product [Hymenolepis diminuta]